MQLISVNIGQKRTQQKGNEIETTGIKLSTPESVRITSFGMRDDFICDQKNHGGLDQAIYVYGAADYAWWSQELEKELAPGTFGDNLTVRELQSAQFNVGDRLHLGSVILEVTAPRIPCGTLARRMGNPQFVKKYRHAERPGLYCRVIREGIIQQGDAVLVERDDGETVPVIELFRDHYRPNKDEATLRRFLRAPLAIRARKDIEEDLQKLMVGT